MMSTIEPYLSLSGSVSATQEQVGGLDAESRRESLHHIDAGVVTHRSIELI